MGDIGKLNEILSGEDCQIIPLSYTSQFGFVFKIVYQDKTEILKTYILVDSNQSSEGRDFELPNYIDVNMANELKGKELDPFDDLPGHVKRMETISNFTKEAQIQREVYNASINNSPLCPEIYDSYILDYINAIEVLELLKNKCREQLEGEKMIQYLQDNLNRYKLGIIRMEYAEGYTTFRQAEKNQTLYENVIYANIRLLMETGYLHLDLNPGNVMVRRDEVLLIDFGKSKSIDDIKKYDFSVILEIIKKESLEQKDIISIIYLINRFDAIENDSSLFQQNFVSNLSNHKTSYQNIANKLNERENKTVSPNYKTLQTQPQNTVVSSNSSLNSVFSLFGPSSPSNKRGSLFGDESPPKRKSLSHDSHYENINPNHNMYLSTPPTTPRGGAKKSKKTKRRSLHNKRTSKKRQNKKRVKLISNK